MDPMTIKKEDVIEAIKDSQVVTRDDVTLTQTEKPNEPESNQKLLELSDDQVNRLKDKVFSFVEHVKDARKERLSLWDKLECQYDGKVVSNSPQIEFELSVPVTMVKCDSVERLIVKGLLESDPKFSCRLRPEAMRQGMDSDAVERAAQSQEDYLDYQLDERINIASPLRKTIHEAVTLQGGILKVPYVYRRVRKVRQEYYSGKKTQGENGAVVPQGLKSFLQNYPTAIVSGEPGYAEYLKLLQFKDVYVEAKYWAVVHDDVKPGFVRAVDFLVRESCEGYEGLCEEEIYGEREKNTYWDLKKKERSKELVNVDELIKDEDGKEKNDYENEEYDVLIMTVMFDMEGDGKEETKLICMFEEKNKVFLGAYEYPYYDVDCIYVPFYVTDKKLGFWKRGIAETLTDSNMAQNAMLNMMLTESWMELITTPIVKEGSDIAEQFLSGRWSSGKPIVVSEETGSWEEELGFLPKPQKAVAAQMMNMLLFLAKYDDDRTGVSSLASGRESPIDPSAPAAKTAMLLRQSGINIEDYIRCILPSFNKVGEIILKLTYQMATEGRRYRAKQRAQRVTGSDPFALISRDDMALETMIESRAASFAFDEVQEKQANLAVFQMLRNDPIVARNPKAIHEMAITLLESWSPMWKAKAEKIVLSNEAFNAEVMKVGIQALGTYMNAVAQQSKMTGVAPAPDIKQYFEMAAQMMAQAFNPQPKEGESV